MLTPDLEQLRPLLNLLNQVFEVERKIEKLDDPGSLARNVRKMRSVFENELIPGASLVYESPLSEPYNDTRTDCEASIIGDSTEDLVIVDVIKPIIRLSSSGMTQIVQRAVVTVESQSTPSEN